MNEKLKVFNGWSGLGGNSFLWDDNEVEVTAVEQNEEIAEQYQVFHPNHKVIVGDAHDYLVKHYKEFDFAWSSPTCQSHGRMMKFTRHDVAKYPDMRLYEEIIFLQHFFKGKYVVENVVPYYEPLIPAQKIGRHLFWANFTITPIEIPKPKNFINSTTTEGKKQMMEWLGMHYEKNIYYEGNHCPTQVLRNAVHPLLGKHIMDCAYKKELTLL